MTDRIVLRTCASRAATASCEFERSEAQPFEVDVELVLDLAPAGATDDLARTVDYGAVSRATRAVVEGPHVGLLETLAEAIATRLLAGSRRHREVDGPGAQAGGRRFAGALAWAGVEIRRTR